MWSGFSNIQYSLIIIAKEVRANFRSWMALSYRCNFMAASQDYQRMIGNKKNELFSGRCVNEIRFQTRCNLYKAEQLSGLFATSSPDHKTGERRCRELKRMLVYLLASNFCVGYRNGFLCTATFTFLLHRRI